MFNLLRKALVVPVLFMLSVVPVLAAQGPQTAQEEYDALLTRVRKSDPTVDFAQLRMLSTKLVSYNPYAVTKSAEMMAAFKAGNYREAIDMADKDLAINYLDIDAHTIALMASSKLGDKAREAHHRYVGMGILKSIKNSGDGKSPSTAFVVIAVSEEYLLMQVMGLQFKKQALVHTGGHDFDVMTAMVPDTGETVEVYFNIDPIWNVAKKNVGK